MRQSRLLLSILLSAVLLFSACSPPQARQGAEASTEATATVPPLSGTESVESVAFVDQEALVIPSFEQSPHCRVTFTPGPVPSQAEIDPKHGGQISLTDSSGNRWSLEIPPYALASKTTITLTEMTSPVSEDLPAALYGGLCLEPDGLAFLAPVRLHLDPADPECLPVPLLGHHDGSGMDFITYDPDTDTIPLEHFSALVFTDSGRLRSMTSLSEIEKKLLATSEKDLKLVRQFLETHKGNIPVPNPPKVPIACEEAQNQPSTAKALQDFISDAYEPEGLLIRMLMKDLAGIEHLGIDTPLTNEIKILFSKLVKRLETKAKALMRGYQGQPDYLIPVTNFALKVAKDKAQLNFTDSPAEGESFILEEIGPWINSALTPVLEKLREEHDYQQAQVALKIASWASLFIGDQSDWIMAEIKKAMAFELAMTIKYTTADSTYAINATVPLAYDFYSPEAGNYLAGSANPAFTLTTSVPDLTMTASPLPIHVLVTEFDPCLGIGKFTTDGLYASAESMVIDGQSVPSAVTKPWWAFAFGPYAGNQGGEKLDFMNTAEVYTFPFTVNNGNATLASESIDGQNNSRGKMTITLEYTITHTPQ